MMERRTNHDICVALDARCHIVPAHKFGFGLLINNLLHGASNGRIKYANMQHALADDGCYFITCFCKVRYRFHIFYTAFSRVLFTVSYHPVTFYESKFLVSLLKSSFP